MTDDHTPDAFEELLAELSKRWGAVHMTYDASRDYPAQVSNVTDEGLPVDRVDKTARGKTLLEALKNAVNENYYLSPLEEEYRKKSDRYDMSD